MAKPLSLDMSAVARRQLHVILLLDCSGSMRGDRIASLNYALRTALPELRAVAVDNPEVAVKIRILRFASQAEWLGEAQDVGDFALSDLVAEGETHMGAALELLADTLTTAAMPGRQLPPVLILASDGLPTDDIDAGLRRFSAAELASGAVRLGIAIGGDADLDILDRFIGDAAIRPLRANNASALVEHIRWATTAPVRAASSPTNAPDPLAPPASLSEPDTTSTEIIW